MLRQPLEVLIPAHRLCGTAVIKQCWLFLSGLPHRGKCEGVKTKQNLSTACAAALERPSSVQQSKRRRRQKSTNSEAGYGLP